MTRLAGQLPKGEANGLIAISRALVDEPERVHAVIALVDCKQVTTDFDSGDVVPTARIRRIEVVPAADFEPIQQFFRRALEQRLGLTALPLDLEDELTAVFEAIKFDPSTGEVLEAPEDQDDGDES